MKLIETALFFNQKRISSITTKNKFNYDKEYVEARYNTYGITNDLMAYLRLGYLIGSIGKTPSEVLDVGYGNASFLRTASTLIKNCFGSDIPPAYPLPEGITFVEDIYSRHFEVITFFDSLEHFENIYDIKNLKCDYILVSMPNCHYLSDEWFEGWKHRRPDEHLWHFNERSLVAFMDSIGFNCLNTTNIEDAIRKPVDKYSNILSGVFVKRK